MGYFSTTVLTPWVPEYRFVHYRSVMAITNASDKWESISASSSRFGRGFVGGKKVRWDEKPYSGSRFSLSSTFEPRSTLIMR